MDLQELNKQANILVNNTHADVLFKLINVSLNKENKVENPASNKNFLYVKETYDVSEKLENLFLIDEYFNGRVSAYTTDSTKLVISLYNGEARHVITDTLYPHLQDYLYDEDIKQVIIEACLQCNEVNLDYLINNCFNMEKMFYFSGLSSTTLVNRMIAIFKEVIGSSISYPDAFYPADYLDPSFLYFIPVKEKFGCIIKNNNKYGAFCFPHAIKKIRL
jgi:hypothetical protein